MELEKGKWDWSFEAIFDLHDHEFTSPLSVNPNQFLAVVCKCLLKPNDRFTRKDFARSLPRKQRTKFPAHLVVACDGTYNGTSVTRRGINVTVAPLKDRFEAHWSRSQYL